MLLGGIPSALFRSWRYRYFVPIAFDLATFQQQTLELGRYRISGQLETQDGYPDEIPIRNADPIQPPPGGAGHSPLGGFQMITFFIGSATGPSTTKRMQNMPAAHGWLPLRHPRI